MKIQKSEVWLSYKQHKIYAQISGNGPDLLIAFPGYDNTVHFFDPALSALDQKFTTYIIDLPLHGKTDWRSHQFAVADFVVIIELILEKTDKKRFSLMGHSFGGRKVLSLLPHFSNQLDRLILLAPDGIKTAGLISIHWVPAWFRKATRSLFNHSHRLLPLTYWLHRNGWIAPRSYAFVKLHLNDPHLRQRIKVYWLSLPDFKIDLKKTKRLIRSSNISVLLVLGKYDKIIPREIGDRLSQDLLDLVSVYIVDEGHLLGGGAILEEINILI